MKKSNLITGILYAFVGLAALITALITETKLDGLLWGIAGAGIVPGALMICKYFYWNSPKRKPLYQEQMENVRIEQQDELKTKLRDKAGRYVYHLNLLVICFAMLLFAALGALELVAHSTAIVLILGGYLLFQFIAGIVIYHKLLRKYE